MCSIKLMQINCLNTNLMITQFKRRIKKFFNFFYNLFITKFENFRKYLNDNFKKEFIVFFLSFANAFIMFVKKEENLRFCVNYKSLNFITVKNRYFISLIKQLLNRLIKITIFTKLNIRFAYNTLRIRINDK